MSNISVTGNEAQFNEKVTFLKDVDIKGTLLVPDQELTLTKLTTPLILGNPQLTITGETTFTDTVNFQDSLSFPDLEIRDRLQVGSGGTVMVADSELNPGKVGIGSTQPTELLDIFGKAKIRDLELKNLLVTGISTFKDDVEFHGTNGISSITFDKSDNSLKFIDNAKLKFGDETTPDLEIYHDGDHSYIKENGTGDIKIQTNSKVTIENDTPGVSGNQSLAKFVSDGGASLFWQGEGTTGKKFQTTGVGASVFGEFVVDNDGSRLARVGIGTTHIVPVNPNNLNDAGEGTLRLAVDGSISISRNIYDSEGSPGQSNYYLKRTGTGIRWTLLAPGEGGGITLQNEGQEVPSAGLAQTFTTINFVQSNSLGIGTDTLVATAADTSTPQGSGLSTVFTNDLWGYNGSGANASIYRMTNVGIGTNLNGSGNHVLHIYRGSGCGSKTSGIGELVVESNNAATIQLLSPSGDTNPQTIYFGDESSGSSGRLQYSHSSDSMIFKTNGNNERLRITATGEVNIGGDYTQTTKKFKVTGNSEIDGEFRVANGVDFDASLDVDGDTSLDALTVDELATFNQNVIIKGNTNIGDASSDSLLVSAGSTFNAGINVNQHTELDDVNITGVTTFNNDVQFIGDDYNIIFDKSDDAFEFGSNAKITFGDSAQLQIFHDGSDGTINNSTGKLNIISDSQQLKSVSGETYLISQVGYGVTLFTDNVKKFETTGVGVTVTGLTDTDTLNVSATSTFDGNIDANADLDVQGNAGIGSLNVVGVSTFIGISTFKEEVGIAKTLNLGLHIKDRNDSVGTTVAENLSNAITDADYNSTTGIMEITIANHGFANGDSIQIPDGTITLSCNYKGVTISQSYPRSKDPNSGKWLIISNVTTNTFKVDVGDGGLAAGVTHNFVSASGGVLHSSGQYVEYDYRLASVGTGVSWRPSGVQTKRTIWVSKSGSDSNSGLLEGDAKATIGAAATIAVETDTIKVRPGVYVENNPIGLRTDVTVTGEDLRLVIIQSQNPTKDVFHVRRGCLVENLNFGGSNVGVNHQGAACVAFPTPAGANSAVSGYTEPGPATEGPSGRWRSPYIRNCTNFMTASVGMRVDGNDATASTIGADLKSMVCDSFTQYNEAGIGVSLTNDAYAQLVSIFTINTDIGIYASSGAQCDLTNSNSSFGNFGLVAAGLGSTTFTGIVSNTDPAGDIITSTNAEQQDTVVAVGLTDLSNNVRRPFDGQALYFKIDLDNYPDTPGGGRITSPLQQLSSVKLIGENLSGFSAIDPPNVLIRDFDGTQEPKGPQGIIAEATASVSASGVLTEITVVAQGRNYLPTQNIVVDIEGNTGLATAIMSPIYYTVETATNPVPVSGITTITFNEFVPYELFADDPFTLQRISRILTSSHSFEYVGTGTDINISTPLQGAIPIKANEVVATDGAQIPFTSTDQKGNFDIGQGLQINQTTSTISGRDFSRSLQAEVTPLILALR